MKLIDISWPISQNMTAYKDRHVVKLTPTKTFAADGARETLITIGSHSGTHIDAPAHFMAQGTTIDAYPLATYVTKAQVIDMMHVKQAITAKDLKEITIQPNHAILFKTTNSLLAPDAPFNPDFVFIAHDAAERLAEQNIPAVGIDYLGIERGQPGHETHKAFMARNIAIIEGLRLAEVPAGIYTLLCLPLNIPGLEAAPARALLTNALQ